MSNNDNTDIEDLIRPDIHSSSAEYRQRFAGKVGEWFLQTQNQITHDLLKEGPNTQTVIDFGGGHGQNIKTCQKLGLQVSILSSDETCNQLIKQEFNSLEYKIGLLTDSQCDPQSYDAVLSYRMLPHLQDWKTHIAELCKVSKGTVVIEFPNSKSVNAFSDKLFALKKSVEGNTRQFTLFSLEQVSAEFESHGFKLITAKGQYLLPMVVHRALKLPSISKVFEKVIGVILPRTKFGSPLICKFQRSFDN